MRYPLKAIIAAVPALLLAFIAYTGATVWSISNNMTTSDNAQRLLQASDSVMPNVSAPEPALAVTNELPADFYMLLLGVDASENRESGDEADLYGGVFRSDSIILAHVNTDTQHVSLCSFQRDLMTEVDGHEDEIYKLNAAYALGGVDLMKSEIKELTGIDNIPFHAVVDMDGLREIIDSVGGIDIDVEDAFYDDVLMGGIDQKGMQTLNGGDALVYARSRYAWVDGDTARARHQRQVLQALAAKFSQQDLFSLMNSAEIISKRVATNMTISQMFEVAGKLQGMDAQANIYSFMTPTVGVFYNEQWFEELLEEAWQLVLEDLYANNGVSRSELDENGMFMHLDEVAELLPSQWRSLHLGGNTPSSNVNMNANTSSTRVEFYDEEGYDFGYSDNPVEDYEPVPRNDYYEEIVEDTPDEPDYNGNGNQPENEGGEPEYVEPTTNDADENVPVSDTYELTDNSANEA